MTRTAERRRDRPAARVEDRLLRGARLSVLAVTVGVQFGLCLPTFVEHGGRYQPLWLEIAGFALMAGVAAVAAACLARDGRIPSPARRAGLALVLLAAVAAAAAAPPGNYLDRAHWYFGLVGWYGVLLLFDRPLAHLAAFLGANLAIALAKAVVSGPPEARAWAAMAVSVVSVYGFQLALSLVIREVRRVAARARQAAEEEERFRTAEAVAEHVHRDHRQRYVALLGAVVPLLAGLGYGSLDPSDPEVRRRCAQEAARMRRLFAEKDDVADRLVHELRAVMEVAEHRGVTVRFAARGEPRDLPRDVRRELIDPVAAVLAAAVAGARVTVVRTPDTVRVSALGDGPAPEGSAAEGRAAPRLESGSPRVAVNAVVAENRVWVEAVWRQATPSR
ncbi:hypothetical protein [Nonomuraea pusilla]|uniref:Signal transduction histidine kinase n=1 Tax=Nonomuraea pusilla TaxID=46177 RepID=A0A1H7X0L5_9ACTN|nr:hypothetical protein [Nonomuraea pusilla]SEM26659.1 hypothetical protein SAMN05660976_04671 [Nonomuraea pusilla]